jgi:hypothetical protein
MGEVEMAKNQQACIPALIQKFIIPNYASNPQLWEKRK